MLSDMVALQKDVAGGGFFSSGRYERQLQATYASNPLFVTDGVLYSHHWDLPVHAISEKPLDEGES